MRRQFTPVFKKMLRFYAQLTRSGLADIIFVTEDGAERHTRRGDALALLLRTATDWKNMIDVSLYSDFNFDLRGRTALGEMLNC